VLVPCVAPAAPGKYVSYWCLVTPFGEQFGDRIWIEISVTGYQPSEKGTKGKEHPPPSAPPAPLKEAHGNSDSVRNFKNFRFFVMLLLVVVLLKAVAAGDSGHARNALNLTRTQTEVTLVTQTSWDRYWMLGHICARWRGPVVVAIFVPRLNGTENPYHTTPQGCNTQVGFKHALHLAHAPKGLESYPVNVLRNTALRLVSTSHFLMVDIDFWPSSNLRHEILAHRPHATRRLAMVVPAFTRNGCVNPLCFTPRGSFLFGLSPHGSLFPPDCIPSQGAMWHFRELPQAADGRKIHAEKPY